MALLKRFGEGLQRARKQMGLTQEDFSEVSSRTYLSSLERGLKAPTIIKIEQHASVIGVHPVALLALAYLPDAKEERQDFFTKVYSDLALLNRSAETFDALKQ